MMLFLNAIQRIALIFIPNHNLPVPSSGKKILVRIEVQQCGYLSAVEAKNFQALNLLQTPDFDLILIAATGKSLFFFFYHNQRERGIFVSIIGEN
jgi:hypothetical protein